MTVYGLYLRDLDEGDLIWFTTNKDLAPGPYRCGRHKKPTPDVYIAESIPALILEVGPLVQEAELRAQSNLAPADLPHALKKRAAIRMTEGLLRRLTETSSIWLADPDWVDELRPFTNPG